MKMRPSALTPLYLPKEAKETALLIMDYHRINCHSGVQATLANIRMKYWFTSGRKTVQRAIYKNCFPCRREALHPYATPPWPQLPTTRVTQARPFFCTGLDFFGPCQIRHPHPDGGFELKKCYVAIFVCMTNRCVHLEICSDLSAEQFLHALRRFGSRREYPARILSDNGQSFLTARQVINQIHRSKAPAQSAQRRNPVRQAVQNRLSSKRGQTTHSVEVPNAEKPTQPTLSPEEEALIDFCQKRKIEWQTITELSPSRGGVYERLIGLIKHCLRRSIGRSKPTEVEFASLLAEAERTANSRPLSYVADSDTDFYLVRPLDILHPLLRDEEPQNPLDPIVEEDCDPNDSDFVAPGGNRLHAKVIQGLKESRKGADTFWIEFRDGYLNDLRSRGVNRKKNQFGKPTIQLGDLVLIKEPDVPRCDWRLALVIDLLPDHDGFIRTARVRFSRTHQEHTRALEHLYPIGNVPRVPARCETTACVDVYLTSVLSDTTVTMATTTTNATPTLSDTSGQAASTTTQPAASTTTHSVEEAVQASGTPPSPTTTFGYDPATDAHLQSLQARCDAIHNAILRSLEAADQTTDEAEQKAIFDNLCHITSAMLVAGPRADQSPSTDQETQTSSSRIPEMSETAHPADQLTDNLTETSSTTVTTEEAPAAPTTATTRQPYVFRGRARMNINATPRQPYQPQAENFETEPGPKAQPPPEDPPHVSLPSVTTSSDLVNEDTPAAMEQPVDPLETFSFNNNHARQPYVFRGRLRMNINETPRQPYQPQAETTHSVATTPPVETPDAETTQANTTHSVAQPTALAAPTPSPPTAPALDPDMAPAQPLFDSNALPGYPEEEEIKRRMRQLFVYVTQNGVTKRKIQDSMLATFPLAEPQSVGFGFNTHFHRSATGRPTNHIWDPVTICDGCNENRRRFHQSLLVFRIIHRDTWRRYTAIATSTELQGVLDHVLTLHVRCLGQMILLVYAVRLQGNHGRIVHIMYFIRDLLKTTDFEFKIPQLLNRFHKRMTEGLGKNVDPLPSTNDFSVAAANWLCYCHKAFVYFIQHLTGRPCWNPDWLQGEELDSKIQSAIREKILTPAPHRLQELRDRAYHQYVLRYIYAIEKNDPSYRWIRLSDAKPDTERNDFYIVKRTTGKTVLFVDEEFFLSPIAKLLKPEVELIRIDSDKDVITPHAQIVLHPYDAYLWQEDKDIIDAGQRLPPWSNPNQDEDGAYYKAGALEARKFNLLTQHRIDLFTWYQGKSVGEFPPAQVREYYLRKDVSRPFPSPLTPHPGEGGFRTSVRVAPATAPVPAPPKATPGPFRTTPPANIVNIFGEQLLVDAIQRVTQQATAEIAAALDAQLSRIEAMLQQRPDEQQPNATAEDRHQDRTLDR